MTWNPQSYNETILEYIDSNSFKALSSLHSYGKDNKNLYFEGNVLDQFDKDSFEVIHYNTFYVRITKDKNGVYCNDQIIKKADPKSFEIIGGVIHDTPVYLKDDHHIFWGGREGSSCDLVLNADPETFSILSYQDYLDNGEVYDAEDKNHKYKNGEIVEIKKINLGNGYFKGRYAIYFGDQRLEIEKRNQTLDAFEIIENSDKYDAKDAVFYYQQGVRKTCQKKECFSYFVTNESVYFDGIEIPFADQNSFEIIFHQDLHDARFDYGKDKNHIYYRENILEGANPEKFHFIDRGYYSDDVFVWFSGVKMMITEEEQQNGEIKTLKTPYAFSSDEFDPSHHSRYLKNKNGIYCPHGKYASFRKLSIDEETLFAYGGVQRSGYRKDKDHVYFDCTRLDGADSESFDINIPGGDWAQGKDKFHVYFEKNIVENADPQTFQILDYQYSQDKDSVFFNENIILDADPKTFQIIEYPDQFDAIDKNYYFKDGEIIAERVDSAASWDYDYWIIDGKIYYLDTEIEGADIESFQIIYGGALQYIPNVYAKDKSFIYFEGEKRSDIDISTFECFHGYCSDKNSVFDDKGNSYNVDVPSFEWEFFYQKDKNHIYCQLERQDNIDRETFEVVNHSLAYLFAKDKNHVFMYCDRTVENADPESFEVLGDGYGGYAKDKHHIFFETDIIEEADTETFEIIKNSDDFDAQDKNHKYLRGEIVE